MVRELHHTSQNPDPMEKAEVVGSAVFCSRSRIGTDSGNSALIK